MGKKSKYNKNNNDKDHLEARAMRIRAEHMSKKVDVKTGKKDCDDIVCSKFLKKERKNAKDLKCRKQNLEDDSRQRTGEALGDAKKDVQRQQHCFVVPNAPRWDETKFRQTVEKSKVTSLANLKKLFESEEDFETEDMAKLDKLYIFNGQSTGNTLEEIGKRSENESETVQQKIVDLRKKLQNAFNEEFELLTDRSKYDIAIEELKITIKQMDPSGNDDSTIIPTRKDFTEITSILRNFIAIRNKRLSSCFVTEMRRNKLADNYTNILVQMNRNKHLYGLLVHRRRNTYIGDKVLELSTKVLERILAQLRYQTQRMFWKSDDMPSKEWSKKLKHFDSLVDLHTNNIARMKTCLITKREDIQAKTEKVKSVDQQLEDERAALQKAEQKFEKDVKDHEDFQKIFDENEGLTKLLAETKEKVSQDLSHAKDLKAALDACKRDERDIDYLFQQFVTVTEQIDASKEKWKVVDQEQARLLKEIRVKNGIILRQEEFQQEMLLEEVQCCNEISFLSKKLQDLLCQNQFLSKQLRMVRKQKINHQPTFVLYEDRDQTNFF